MAELVIDVLDRCRTWPEGLSLDDGLVARTRTIDYAFGRLDVTALFNRDATASLHSVCLTFDDTWTMEYCFKRALVTDPPRPEARLVQHDLTGLTRCVGSVLTSSLAALPPAGMSTTQWHQLMQMHPFLFKLTNFEALMPPRQPLQQLYPPPDNNGPQLWPAATLRPVAAPTTMVFH